MGYGSSLEFRGAERDSGLPAISTFHAPGFPREIRYTVAFTGRETANVANREAKSTRHSSESWDRSLRPVRAMDGSNKRQAMELIRRSSWRSESGVGPSFRWDDELGEVAGIGDRDSINESHRAPRAQEPPAIRTKAGTEARGPSILWERHTGKRPPQDRHRCFHVPWAISTTRCPAELIPALSPGKTTVVLSGSSMIAGPGTAPSLARSARERTRVST